MNELEDELSATLYEALEDDAAAHSRTRAERIIKRRKRQRAQLKVGAAALVTGAALVAGLLAVQPGSDGGGGAASTAATKEAGKREIEVIADDKPSAGKDKPQKTTVTSDGSVRPAPAGNGQPQNQRSRARRTRRNARRGQPAATLGGAAVLGESTVNSPTPTRPGRPSTTTTRPRPTTTTRPPTTTTTPPVTTPPPTTPPPTSPPPTLPPPTTTTTSPQEPPPLP